jgi:putative endopeptidase
MTCIRAITIATLGAAVIATAAAAQTSSSIPQHRFSVEFLDRSVDACTDFYQFACGNWLTKNPLPSDRARLGRMTQLADRNDQIVRDILERAAAKTSGRTRNEQLIGDYYASCMDEATINKKGAQPIQPLLETIDSVRSRSELVRVAGRFNRLGLPAFIGIGPGPDNRDSTIWIANVGQGALGLPDRDLYLRDDERSTGLRKDYVAHVQNMFELLGESPEQAKKATQAVMDAEMAVAKATMDRVAFRDPKRRDNPMTVDELATLGPNFEFPLFFGETGAPTFTRVNVLNPQYVRDINTALDTLPLDTWKAYMRWRLLSTAAPYLSANFEQERFRFAGTVLSGQKEMRPRWKRCTTAVAGTLGDDQLGEIVGEIFVKEHFGPEAKTRMDELITALGHSLEKNITELDWMGPATKKRALAKLAAMNRKIGAPQKWRDFSRVTIVGNDYWANVVNVSKDDARRQLLWIGTKVDRDQWLMTPQTVNAYYAPPLNEIAFPAGILQPPFFDVAKDDAVNFGGIGSVIGHELSHGFDDSGRRFDEKGNLTDWWTAEDDKAFRDRAACMSKQYGAYTVAGDAKVRGDLTLGENVADNAGVRIAYYALMEVLAKKSAARDSGRPPLIDGFTPQQRFFLAWAQAWCTNATEQDARRQVQEDTHAPGKWRANGVLHNSQEFRDAFTCKLGTPMAPENTCRVW